MTTIEIKNVKSIRKLQFVIPETGVHVLTGVNGSGKTTLLTCLERITNPYAFQRHFRTSATSQFDNYQSSEITYTHKNSTVKYLYRNTRWAPNPRANSKILKSLGFKQAVYITSSGTRFYVQNEELNAKKISAAPQFFKDSLNEIFQTTKYGELRRVKLIGKGRGSGRWNYGFVMPSASQGGLSRYYTEKNFSLGEILILNALFELNNLEQNSLVLIDEIELALHPKVQVKFLHFLEKIAQQKNLTVIISTHSSSLIKAAPKLIHLERLNNGEVHVDYDCYPTLVLKNVAIEEDIHPDIVFFVEDISAKNILDEILDLYFKYIYKKNRPIIKVLPIAGWAETMKFTVASSGYLTPKHTKSYAFLDLDVKNSLQSIQNNPKRTKADSDLLDIYNSNSRCIQFLPFTPEIGIVDVIRSNHLSNTDELRDFFNATFDTSQIIIDEENRGIKYSDNPNKEAKVRFEYYLERIKASTNREISQIRLMLAQYCVSKMYSDDHDTLKKLLNPIFS